MAPKPSNPSSLWVTIVLICMSIGLCAPDHDVHSHPAIYDGSKWLHLQDKPSRPIGQSMVGNETVLFTSIASYRDGPRCGRTLFSMFNEAEFPQRLRVGVVQQNDEDDVDCEVRYELT
jgi:hypothetical protein